MDQILVQVLAAVFLCVDIYERSQSWYVFGLINRGLELHENNGKCTRKLKIYHDGDFC
jgi:hypothetical protein